jgi:hypothetical protein
LHGGEDKIGEKFFFQIADVELAGPGFQGFGFQTVVFFTLSKIGTKTDHVAVIIIFQPGHDNRRIQAAAVG